MDFLCKLNIESKKGWNHEKNNNNKENRVLKVAMYIRVGSTEQLSLETEQRYFNLKVESLQNGEESNADNSCEKEKFISYSSHTGI